MNFQSQYFWRLIYVESGRWIKLFNLWEGVVTAADSRVEMWTISKLGNDERVNGSRLISAYFV